MGCFIACFRSSSDVNKRRKQRRRKVLPREQPVRTANAVSELVHISPSTVDTASDRSISPILKARDRPEEQLNLSVRKRVTFDSNVKTYEPDDVEAEGDVFLGKDGEKKEEEKDLAEISQSQCKSYSEEGSTVSSVSSYPPNHRYQNCRDSDDEDELDYADSDHVDTDVDDDDDDDDVEDEEYDDYDDGEDGIRESSERSSAEQVFADEADSCLSVCGCPGKSESIYDVRRTARDRNASVHSVLKPVENITQWKAVKVKDKHQLNPPPRKENSALNGAPPTSFGREPSLKKSSFRYKSETCQSKNSDQDIAVDASLSNWLSSSEVTPPSKTGTHISVLPTPESQGSNSSKTQEDRPILGALTMEELKQFSSPRRSPNRRTDDMMGTHISVLPTPESQGSNSSKTQEDRPILGALTMEELKQFSSPRRSPNRRTDDMMPIIGTVGTYWSHSGSVEDSGPASSFKRVSNTSGNYREMRVK